MDSVVNSSNGIHRFFISKGYKAEIGDIVKEYIEDGFYECKVIAVDREHNTMDVLPIKKTNESKSKLCKLTNDVLSWILEVDGNKINFVGSHNADYFEQHYKSLGYIVERDNDKWKREE